MKVLLFAILILVVGDLAITHGANTAIVVRMVLRFLHSITAAGRDSILVD